MIDTHLPAGSPPGGRGLIIQGGAFDSRWGYPLHKSENRLFKEGQYMANMNSYYGGFTNGDSTVAADYDIKSRQIVKLREATEGQRIFGYLITKEGKYGRGVLLCCEDELVSLPKRCLDLFLGYDANRKALLKSGRIRLTNIRQVDTKSGNKAWVYDLESDD